MENDFQFAAGKVVSAVFEAAHDGCAYFKVPGAGAAVLSLKALGMGTIREDMSNSLHKGMNFQLVVKSWNPQNRQIVFADFAGGFPAGVSCKFPQTPKIAPKGTKPQYKLLPKGTLFLVDGANYLSEFRPEDVACAFRGLKDGLSSEGYRVHFFLESRTLNWILGRLENQACRAALQRTFGDLGVTMVKHESDSVILQVMSRFDNSVGLSCDHFDDYAAAYPDLVGSSRVRDFTVFPIGKDKLVTIEGVRSAICIPSSEAKPMVEPEKKEALALPPVTEEDDGFKTAGEAVPEKPRHVRVFGVSRMGGLVGAGYSFLDKGKIVAAAHCFSKVAEKNPCGFAALADVYAGDANLAAKYDELAEQARIVQRESFRRSLRISAERRRARAYVSLCA